MPGPSLRIDTTQVNAIAADGIAKSNFLSQQCSTYQNRATSLAAELRSLNNERLNLRASLTSLSKNMEAELQVLKSKISSINRDIESTNRAIAITSNKQSSLPSDDVAGRTAMSAQTTKSLHYRAELTSAVIQTNAEMDSLLYELELVYAKLDIQSNAAEEEETCILNITNIANQLGSFQNTISQRREMYSIMSRYATSFANTDASSIMSAFGLSGALSGLNSRMKKDLLASRDGVDGTGVFANGIKGTDVRQGGLGDCWTVAVLSGLAYTDKKAIENSIEVVGENEYRVKLYDKDGNMFHVPVNKIDIKLMEDINCGESADMSQEEWVAILEAALAKSPQVMKDGSMKRDFNRQNDGGFGIDSESIYTAITGGKASSLRIQPEPLAKLAGSLGHSDTFAYLTNGLKNNGVVMASTQGVPKDAPPEVVNFHAFTVVNTYVHKGKEYVSLRNPWGAGEGTDNGLFTLDIKTFNKYYKDVTVGTQR
jgi:predicted  nucleic acid-binding Zn-ribbon protein